MSAWKSSSLAFSDNTTDSSNMKKSIFGSKPRVSKQDVKEHKMFGSKRKGIQLGKTFSKKGKGVGNNSPITAHQQGNAKGSGVSPSMAEFDKMMDNVTKNSKGFGKKSMLNRKQFG